MVPFIWEVCYIICLNYVESMLLMKKRPSPPRLVKRNGAATFGPGKHYDWRSFDTIEQNQI
jgi:hypothetical protein